MLNTSIRDFGYHIRAIVVINVLIIAIVVIELPYLQLNIVVLIFLNFHLSFENLKIINNIVVMIV